MFDNEAARICEILLGAGPISPLLDVGSATRAVRMTVKPHIESALFAPLRARGVEISHCDLKPGDGVDVAGDIVDPELRRELKARGYKCLLLANVLEHVRDPDALAAACEEIVGPGGLILATVPSSYPYHADPIDTLFRPAPDELAVLFRRSEPRIAETLAGRTFRETIRASGSTVMGEAARTALWALAAPFRPRSFRARLDRWFWYARPYRVSIALLAVR